MQLKSFIQSINWSEELWTVPNMLTFSRLVILPVILYFIALDTTMSTWIAFVLLLVISGTDLLDGYMARRLHEKSNFGRMIDPVIDKICLDAIIITLAFTSELPIWYMIFLVLRDLFLIVGGMFLIFNKQIIMESNWPGKLSFASNVLVIITYLFAIEPLKFIAIMVATAVVSISTINYFIIPFADALGMRAVSNTRTYRIDVNDKSRIDLSDTR